MHAALPPAACLPLGPAGRYKGCAQLRSWDGSLRIWRGLTSRTCRCPREMQRAGSTSGARVWIMPAPIVVIPTRIPRQPSKKLRGEAVLAAVVKSAAGRVSAQCRPAPGLQKGHLQCRLLFLVTSPRRITFCLVLPSSQDGLPRVRSSCWSSVSYSVLEITSGCVISTFTADWLPARSQCALRLPYSKM